MPAFQKRISGPFRYHMARPASWLLFASLLTAALAISQEHVVRDGDTLWDISDAYLENPFAWPEVWRKNPQINDPHWIYPGDRIALPGQAAGGAVAQRVSMGSGSPDVRATSFRDKLGMLAPDEPATATNTQSQGSAGDGDVIATTYAAEDYRTITDELLITAPFVRSLEEGQVFYSETDIVARDNSSGLLQLYGKMILKRGSAHQVREGDRYLVYEIYAKRQGYRSNKSLGNLIWPKGVVRIDEVGEQSSKATLVECFGSISSRAKAAPLEVPPSRPIRGYSGAATTEPSGQVIYISDKQELVQPFSYVIADIREGVSFNVGDGVAILDREESGLSDRLLGQGLVLRIEANTVTVLLQNIEPGRLNRGDLLVLAHQAVF